MSKPKRNRPLSWTYAAVGLALLLGGCGGGGDDPGDQFVAGSGLDQGLTVSTMTLPPAQAGEDYGPIHLTVREAPSDAVTWSLWAGALPAGMTLDEDGALRGTPTESGLSVFSLHATDGDRAGIATRAVAVDAFGLYARGGLTVGEAWTGQPVSLATVGAAAGAAIEIVSNRSGGFFRSQDPATGTAVWVPGAAGHPYCEDLLRARDGATGREHEIVLPVRADPTGAHTAEFGTTDVWFLGTGIKRGTHPYACDLHAAMARIGLRGPGSSSLDAVGRPVDYLMDQYVRLELLRTMDRIFQRDGSPEDALAISFPFHEPGAGYMKPAPGTYASGGVHRYNEISILDGRVGSIVGTAFIDSADNRALENDTTHGGLELGVFINVLMPYYEQLYPSPLASAPIAASDEEALHALIHDLPETGGRYRTLRTQTIEFARVLATILAHEIGHSLGLEHTVPAQPGSLMNGAASISPWLDPSFSAADLERLRRRLPGTGRADLYGAASKPGVAPSAHGMPGGGVSACPGSTCHLRLPALVTPRRERGDAHAPRFGRRLR